MDSASVSGRFRRQGGKAQVAGQFGPDPSTVGQHHGQRQLAVGGADGAHPDGQLAWNERRRRLVPYRLVALVRGQVDRGAPAAGHRDQVGIDPAHLAAGLLDLDRLDGLAAERTADNRSLQEFRAAIPGRASHRVGRLAARIDHRRHRDPGRMQLAQGADRVVVVGEQHRLLADLAGETVQVGPHRTRQHHARPVVVAEHQGPLDGTRGDDAPLGEHPPSALARLVRTRLRQMVGHPLDDAERTVVVGAEHGRARHQAHLGQAGQLGHRVGDPGAGVVVADGVAIAAKPAAEGEVLLRHDHPCASSARDQGRHQPGGTAARDQEVAMGVGFFVSIRVRTLGGAAEAGGPADQRLVDLLPERCRPHEGLVVEPGRQNRAEQPIDGAHVEAERRPAVLAHGLQPVEQFDGGGLAVRLAAPAAAQLDQRVGFF